MSIKTGMLLAIADLKGVSQNTDDLAQFEQVFNKWHTHILMTDLKWYYNVERPFVIVNPLGVFDNLVNFSRRLYLEVVSEHRGFSRDCEFECEIMFFGGDRLSVDIHIDGIDSHIDCRFLSSNQEIRRGTPEGFKFDISKEEIK